jgi:hypothetical protein
MYCTTYKTASAAFAAMQLTTGDCKQPHRGLHVLKLEFRHPRDQLYSGDEWSCEWM